MLDCRVGSFVSRTGELADGALDFKSCSRIFVSCGSGLRATSAGGDGGIGAGVCGTRGPKIVLLLGGTGIR